MALSFSPNLGVQAGVGAGLSFDTLCWAWPWASFPIQASLEPAGPSEDALTWPELQCLKFLAPREV